jgi:hypothetical protein
VKQRGCAFVLLNRPNLRRLEVEVTTRCNLLCRHCDRRCSQAPEAADLPIAVAEQFVAESQALGHAWQKIGLLGGEPTLHPQLRTLISIFKAYVATLPACEFFLVSNAHGERVQQVLKNIRDDITVVERPKTDNEPWFNNMDLAPVDLCSEVSSCTITSDCGLALTSRGYFPCGAGAGIARALDLDIGVRSLRDVSEESMVHLLRQLCQYCGHALAIRVEKDAGSSPFWERATAARRERHRRRPRGSS